MKNKKVGIFRWIWYAVLGFLIVGYILMPFFQTVLQAVQTEDGYSLQVFGQFFSNPNQRKVIGNTVVLGVLSVFTCGVIGIMLAMYMTFLVGKWKKVIHILLLSPMMIPGVITVISFIQLYGESGILTKAVQYALHLEKIPYEFQGLGAIVFVITYTQYVYFYLNVYVALKYVDNSGIEAARSMGASWWKIFRDVICRSSHRRCCRLRLSHLHRESVHFLLRILIGGGYKVLSTQIVRSKANNHMEMASVQVIVLFLISLAVMMTIQYFGKRYRGQSTERSTPIQAGKGRRSVLSIVSRLIVFLQIVFIILPIVTIVYLSFTETSSIMQEIFPHAFTLENYRVIFEKPRVLKPLLNSLKMSAIAVAVGLLITVPSSYMLVKYKNKFHTFLKVLLLLPWTMPASVVAINLINAFGQETIFAFGQSLIGGFAILPIAYTITAIPLLLNSNETAILGMNPNIEEASKSLGANMFYTFTRVVIPNIAPGILAGGVLVLIRTIGEYTMSACCTVCSTAQSSISMVTNMQE